MAKAKAERGAKAAFVREGVQRHPDLMPKALADKLNEEVREKGLNLGQIKGQEISQAKLRLRQAAAKGTQQHAAQPRTHPTPAVAQQPASTTTETVTIEDFRTLKNLADRLGRDRLRELLDLLG